MLARFGVFEWSMVAVVVLGIAAGAVVVTFHLLEHACLAVSTLQFADHAAVVLH